MNKNVTVQPADHSQPVKITGGLALTWGSFIAPSNGFLQIGGDLTVLSGSLSAGTGSTVVFDGASTQNMPNNLRFYNLTIANAVDVQAGIGLDVANTLLVSTGQFRPGDLSTFKDVTVAPGASIQPASNTRLYVSGNWSLGDNGGFFPNGGTVTLTGSAPQTINANDGSFNNLSAEKIGGEPGLVTYYKFDHGAGPDLTDSSGNGHTGVKFGSGLSDGVPIAPTRFQNFFSAQFGGSDGYIEMPSNLNSASAFTFAAWVHWSGGSDGQRIFDFGHDANSYVALSVENAAMGGVLRYQVTTGGPASGQTVVAPANLISPLWTHVVVTLGPLNGLSLYVNGVRVGRTDTALRPSDLAIINNWLGRSEQAGDPYYNGLLDDVRLLRPANSRPPRSWPSARVSGWPRR